MLPHFFRHYDRFVDHYFIYDNGSTDDSLSLLKDHPRVTLHHFETSGDSFVEEERRLGDTIWQGSDADWVIVTDIDEHIFHPDLPAYLLQCTEAGVTAIQSIGYEMVSNRFPITTELLCGAITTGARSTGHDRLCIFNPRALTETNFSPGRHTAKPAGRVCWPDYPQVLLLHFKQLGKTYLIERSAELLRGLRSRDLQQGWGTQYTWSTGEIIANWKKLKSLAGPVPGLGKLKHLAPDEYGEEERVVRNSGLIDAKWYLATYPDVESAAFDPLRHFCIHGWKEGRRPNFYFDTEWYCLNYLGAKDCARNPLLDYIVRGEREDRRPSPHFDTGWYRTTHQISLDESPLQHYLQRRKSGVVSPVPDFDVIGYCRDHPGILNVIEDPFEHHSKESR
jgi:hypothetical protein